MEELMHSYNINFTEPSKFAHRMARSLCILHERGLFLQSEDGDCVDLPLPYPIRWIRPFPLGLLLEVQRMML